MWGGKIDGPVHLSLERNSPTPRTVENRGPIVGKAVLGGLHHRYSRAA